LADVALVNRDRQSLGGEFAGQVVGGGPVGAVAMATWTPSRGASQLPGRWLPGLRSGRSALWVKGGDRPPAGGRRASHPAPRRASDHHPGGRRRRYRRRHDLPSPRPGRHVRRPRRLGSRPDRPVAEGGGGSVGPPHRPRRRPPVEPARRARRRRVAGRRSHGRRPAVGARRQRRDTDSTVEKYGDWHRCEQPRLRPVW